MINKQKTTLTDIARLANVSESTVSRALSGSTLVNDKTKEKIINIAQELNFEVDSRARSLRLQKTHTIAVIVLFGPTSNQSISDPFLLDILGIIADELALSNYDLLLSTHNSRASDWYSYYIEAKRADGLIIIGQGEHDPRIETLFKQKAPFVVWGAPAKKGRYLTVGSNNVDGGYVATKHLIEQGCSNIVFLGDIHHNEIEMRWEGYRKAIEEAGLSVNESLRITVDFTSESAYNGIHDFLVTADKAIDGIFAVSDGIALGAMKYLAEKDLLSDVAIVGFDDIAVSSFCMPSLTTIRQNTQKGGELLVKSILNKINKQPTTSKILDVELVVRESSVRTKSLKNNV